MYYNESVDFLLTHLIAPAIYTYIGCVMLIDTLMRYVRDTQSSFHAHLINLIYLTNYL